MKHIWKQSNQATWRCQHVQQVSGIPESDLYFDLWFLSYRVQILMQGKNPGIAWKYALPKSTNGTQQAAERQRHAWSTVHSHCSVSCGGGRPWSMSDSQVSVSSWNRLFHCSCVALLGWISQWRPVVNGTIAVGSQWQHTVLDLSHVARHQRWRCSSCPQAGFQSYTSEASEGGA